MARKTNKSYSIDLKTKILKEHLVDQIPVTELCRKYKISPSVYYGWQKSLFEPGSLEQKRNSHNDNQQVKKLQKQVLLLTQKMQQKNMVISELMEEHISLIKKSNGGI